MYAVIDSKRFSFPKIKRKKKENKIPTSTCSHGPSSNETALNELVRILPQDLTILAGSWLALIGIHHQILWPIETATATTHWARDSFQRVERSNVFWPLTCHRWHPPSWSSTWGHSGILPLHVPWGPTSWPHQGSSWVPWAQFPWSCTSHRASVRQQDGSHPDHTSWWRSCPGLRDHRCAVCCTSSQLKEEEAQHSKFIIEGARCSTNCTRTRQTEFNCKQWLERKKKKNQRKSENFPLDY